MLKLKSFVFVMFFFLIGCKVGPNYHMPNQAIFKKPTANNTFISKNKKFFSENTAPNKWWKLYNDPMLNKLIEEALCANTDLRVAVANLARANAEFKAAKSVFYPSTNIHTAYSNYHVSAETFVFKKPIPSLPFVNYLEAGSGIILPLDFFGKIRRGIEASIANQEAVQAARDLALITVVAETTSAYTDICAAGYQLTVAEHLLKLQKETTHLTKRLEKDGRGTELDVSRSMSELEQIKATIPSLKASKKNAFLRLAFLTGHTPGELNQNIMNCKKIPKIHKLIPIGDGASLLRRRPDIREAERNLVISTAKIGIATADLYPDISLGMLAGTLGHWYDATKLGAFVWNTGPLIKWTFPNTSIIRAQIAQAKADALADFAKFDSAVLTALKEVETNLTTYSHDIAQYHDLKLAQEQSHKAFLQAKTLYLNGREGYLSTLEAEMTLTNVSVSLANAESRLITDQINLFLSLGGGWC